MAHTLKNCIAVAGLAVVALTGAAQADLVTNGGFETGDFTGWSRFGNPGFTAVQGNFGGVDPTSGASHAYFGPVGSIGGIYQSLAAFAGTTIQVSFMLHNFGGTPNSFSATLDGIDLVPSLVNAGAFNYTLFTGTVTVANDSPELRFSFVQNPSFFLLDEVSANNINVVPLPAPVLMGMGGLAAAGLVGAVRRRRVAKA